MHCLISCICKFHFEDGSCCGAYETKENNLTIGGSIENDIRIKIPDVDPYICKIALDDFGRVRHFSIFFLYNM